MKKINVGGGKHWHKDGWENIDLGLGHNLNQGYLKNYKDNSVDIIYTSHCIEHLPWKNVDNVLKDLYRILKPGGLIRIVLPDVDIMWKIIKNKDRDILERNNPGYYRSGGGGALSNEFCVYELFGYDRKGERFLENTMHKAFFNESIINIMLSAAGFSEVEMKEFCNSNIEEMCEPQTGNPLKKKTEGFDNPDTQDISLFLECRK